MTPKVDYALFGLALKSNRPIPGLEPLANLPVADVEVWFGDGPPYPDYPGASPPEVWYISPDADRAEAPVLKVWKLQGGAFFRLRYGDGVEFVVDRRGTRVWASWPGKATLEDVTVYLLGPVLGFLLRLRGITCLHASAVAAGNGALAFLGPPGAGKSTTAAAFAQRGHPVLTDDITALKEHGGDFLVLPGGPRLCLWSDSVNSLFGSPEALPRLTPEYAIDPEWDKRWLDLSARGYRFQSQPLPLRAIYLLDQRRPEAVPALEPLPPGAGLVSLAANTYKSEFLERELREQEFDFLGRVAARVPIRRVTPLADQSRLPELCDLILADFQSLAAVSPGRNHRPRE